MNEDNRRFQKRVSMAWLGWAALVVLMFFIFAQPAHCAGTVRQSIQQLGASGNYVVVFDWTGDAVNGSLPTTAASFQGAPTPAGGVQGYRILQVETAPGSPAPTNGYNVALLDGLGADFMAGALAGLSSTAAQFFSASSITPPINGTFSLRITGQNIASAQGKVAVYFGPLQFVSSTAGSQGPVGLTGPAGPAGTPGTGNNVANYTFTQSPGGTLSGGISNIVPLAPCPDGVNGTDANHFLYISGGTGAAEAAVITGGTCVALAPSGTVIFTPINGHSGAWTIQSATGGAQEAHSALPTGGGTLIFPTATYTLLSVLTLSKSDLILQGSGWNTKITGNLCGTVLVNIVGSRIAFRDLWFENTCSPDAVGNIALNVTVNATDISVDHCRFSGLARTQGVTMNATGIKGVSVSNSYFNGVDYGVIVNLSATDFMDLRVVNNRFVNIGEDAILVNTPGAGPQAKGIQITGNYCLSPGTTGTVDGACASFAGAQDVEVTGNHFENCAQQCIHVENKSFRVTITGNTINGTLGPTGSKDGIMLIDCSFCTVSGNSVRGTTDNGIHLIFDGTNQSKQTALVGNTITQSGGQGIQFSGNASVITEILVANNISVANTGDGIRVNGSGVGYKVLGNISRRNTGWGINFVTGPATGTSIIGNDVDANTAGAINALPTEAVINNNRGHSPQQGTLGWGCTGTPTASAVLIPQYTPPTTCTIIAESNQTKFLVPNAGVLKNFRVLVTGTVAVATPFTLRKNGVDTIVGCTVPTGTTDVCSDVANSVAVAAGDAVSYKFITGPAETFTNPIVAFEY